MNTYGEEWMNRSLRRPSAVPAAPHSSPAGRELLRDSVRMAASWLCSSCMREAARRTSRFCADGPVCRQAGGNDEFGMSFGSRDSGSGSCGSYMKSSVIIATLRRLSQLHSASVRSSMHTQCTHAAYATRPHILDGAASLCLSLACRDIKRAQPAQQRTFSGLASSAAAAAALMAWLGSRLIGGLWPREVAADVLADAMTRCAKSSWLSARSACGGKHYSMTNTRTPGPGCLQGSGLQKNSRQPFAFIKLRGLVYLST